MNLLADSVTAKMFPLLSFKPVRLFPSAVTQTKLEWDIYISLVSSEYIL